MTFDVFMKNRNAVSIQAQGALIMTGVSGEPIINEFQRIYLCFFNTLFSDFNI